jgi:hypothetical protein
MGRSRDNENASFLFAIGNAWGQIVINCSNSDVALRSVLIVFTRSRPTPPKRTAIQCAERRVEKRMSFRCPPRPHLSVVLRVSAKRVEFLRNSPGTANRNAQICQQSKRSQATAGTFYGQYEGWKAGSQQFLLSRFECQLTGTPHGSAAAAQCCCGNQSPSLTFAASTSGAPVHDAGDPGQLAPRYLPRVRPTNRITEKMIH